ncbi:DUF134 domain-containing protein [Candidatus Dojkabacteria bacterium]|nr:DUF134 domain-containing protein [Candidatus Dojkabacteria bacterium]
MRHRFRRHLGFRFNDIYFKPRGIRLQQLQEVTITHEELETIRLRYIEKLDQDEAAEKMGISQSQYQRDITTALEKITKALIEGMAINIQQPQ